MPKAPFLLAAATISLSGCTIYETPDGHQLWSVHGPTTVQAELGKPDMIEEQDHYVFGPYTVTKYTYFDRGYIVRFVNHSVRGVRPIADADRADIERRLRAYREEVPRLSVGAAASEVIAVFGAPDHIEVQSSRDGTMRSVYSGPYKGQIGPSIPGEQVLCYWERRGVYVVVENGRVTKVRPLTQWDLSVMRGRDGE